MYNLTRTLTATYDVTLQWHDEKWFLEFVIVNDARRWSCYITNIVEITISKALRYYISSQSYAIREQNYTCQTKWRVATLILKR